MTFNQTDFDAKWKFLFGAVQIPISDKASICLHAYGVFEVTWYYRKILNKFLSELSSKELVTRIDKDVKPDFLKEEIAGRYSEKFLLFCDPNNIENVITNKPVKFLYYSEIEPNDEEKFKNFISILATK